MIQIKDLIIYINKQIGETGQLREEATIDHIVAHSDTVANDIATQHPFVDGNKRTAYIVLMIIKTCPIVDVDKNNNYFKVLIRYEIDKHRKWLDILRNC